MRFQDIIGQDATKRRLIQMAEESRIPHALLLSGRGGIGKLQLAIAYAQYLACERVQGGGNNLFNAEEAKERRAQDSCGCCPSCLKYANLQHPDLHFVFPIFKPDGSKTVVCDDFGRDFRELVLEKGYFGLDEWSNKIRADKKQCVIYEAESSEILRKLSLRSFGNGYKVMIIWLPERMNVVCANKLLKILEEPAEKTLFILVSNEPQQLLTTITSRVQQIRCEDIDETLLARALHDREEVELNEAFHLAHIAQGSYLKALHLLGNREEDSENLEVFIAVMRAAFKAGKLRDGKAYLELKQLSQRLSDKTYSRDRQKRFLEYMLQQVRENFVRNYGQPEINYQTVAEEDFSTNFAPYITGNNAPQMMAQIDLAYRQIDQNGLAGLIFFDLFLQLSILLIRK